MGKNNKNKTRKIRKTYQRTKRRKTKMKGGADEKSAVKGSPEERPPEEHPSLEDEIGVDTSPDVLVHAPVGERSPPASFAKGVTDLGKQTLAGMRKARDVVIAQGAQVSSQVRKALVPKEIVYRFGLEFEGCYDITESLTDEEFTPAAEYWYTQNEEFPVLLLDCENIPEEKKPRITTVHFDQVKEIFPCKQKNIFPSDPVLSLSPQFNYGERTQCSTELILKSENKYYVGLNGHELSYLTQNEEGSEVITGQINEDITAIMDVLEPDLLEGLDRGDEDTGLALHFHISDESMVAQGENFLSTGTLRFCMVLCFLWYGCPGKYEHSFCDKFVELGYNYDRREPGQSAYVLPEGRTFQPRGPAGFLPVSEFKPVPEINWEEFERIFEGLTTEEGFEPCICYLLKTMYPNNFKYMPIHIYNLTDILESYRSIWITLSNHEGGSELRKEGGWEYYDKDIVEVMKSIANQSGEGIYGAVRKNYIGGRMSDLKLKYLLRDYGALPLRVEFRFARLKSENHVGFIENYSKLIARFFDHAKEISTSWTHQLVEGGLDSPELVLGGDVLPLPPMVPDQKIQGTKSPILQSGPIKHGIPYIPVAVAGRAQAEAPESLKEWLKNIHMERWYEDLVEAGLDHVIDIVSNFQENPELVRTTLNGIGIPPPHVDALEWAAKKDPRYVAQVKA